jgi:hypothetical protein
MPWPNPGLLITMERRRSGSGRSNPLHRALSSYAPSHALPLRPGVSTLDTPDEHNTEPAAHVSGSTSTPGPTHRASNAHQPGTGSNVCLGADPMRSEAGGRRGLVRPC